MSTYRMTQAQRDGINAANLTAMEYGIPNYMDVLQALAGLAVAVRDRKSTAAALTRACNVLEAMRNDSAPRR